MYANQLPSAQDFIHCLDWFGFWLSVIGNVSVARALVGKTLARMVAFWCGLVWCIL